MIKVMALGDLPENTPTAVALGEDRLLLLREGDTVHVLENRCSHDNGDMTNSRLVNGCVECPRHGARFDIATGAVRSMPAIVGIKHFSSEIRDGDIYVDL